MTSRRHLLAAFALAAFCRALAQQKVFKIGMLGPRPLNESLYTGNIVRRLEQLGYRRGSEIELEYRYTTGGVAAYEKLVQDLVARKCDLIINVGTAAAASALSKADVRTPVVFLAINYDPVRAGVVKSFARPGGNATGVYLQHEAVAPKRLDVLREVLPRARRFAVLSDQHTLSQLEAIRLAASKTDLALTVVPAEGDLVDLAAAVERAKTAKVEGVVVLGSPIFAQRYRELADLLLKRRLPGIGSTAAADGGLLFAYGSDNMKAAMRTAELAARVLKGAKPAETPVEQADEFELVINVKTAKALGIKLPYALLARASRVIQ